LFYSGNPNLKAAGVAIDFTREQVTEYIKCSKDCLYFIKTYMKIVHVDRGVIDFIPFLYQEEIITKVTNNRHIIAKLGRQMGKSTIIAGILMWYFLFNDHFNIAILANKEAQSREILARIKLAYEQLPHWLQQGIVEWNKGSIIAENGSKIFAAATSSNAIRGQALNLCYMDEFAFVENNIQEEFFTSVFPTISSGHTTKLIITSTPNGMNLFYKLWVDSVEKRNAFVRVQAIWSDMPGRDEKWKKDQLGIMTEQKFSQEHETEFLGSTNTLISGATLRRLSYIDPLTASTHLKIYAEPDATRIYVMAVDTARGDNNDFSACMIFDVTEVPYTIAVIYKNNSIPAMAFPSVVYEMGMKYNQAFAIVETNDLGSQVADILYHDLEYPHMVMTCSNGRSGTSVSQGFGTGSKLGLKTTQPTKRVGCSNLKTLVESDKLIVTDYDLIYELSRFTLQGTTYKAEDGNDDLVMCTVIFSWLQTQPYMKEITNNDLRHNVYMDNVSSIEADMVPFGIIDDGRGEVVAGFIELGNRDFDKWLMGDDNY
jgi:hypothetical protein